MDEPVLSTHTSHWLAGGYVGSLVDGRMAGRVFNPREEGVKSGRAPAGSFLILLFCPFLLFLRILVVCDALAPTSTLVLPSWSGALATLWSSQPQRTTGPVPSPSIRFVFDQFRHDVQQGVSAKEPMLCR